MAESAPIPETRTAPVFEADGVFGIGRVFARMASVVGPDFVTFLALVALFAVPERIVVHTMDMNTPLAASLAKLALATAGFGLQIATTYLALQRFAGTPAGFGACIAKALTAFFPALLLMAFAGLGGLAAMLLLVVPGVMLMTAWAVVLPVYLAEGGLFASFGRSAALTKGHRWKVFAVLLLLGFVLGLLATMLMPIWGLHGMMAMLVFANNNWLMKLIFSAFTGLTIAAIYQELRGAAEAF